MLGLRKSAFALCLATKSSAFVAPGRGALAPKLTRTFASPPVGDLAERMLAAKKATGKTFDELAGELGWTNAYTCQLLLGQAQVRASLPPSLARRGGRRSTVDRRARRS